MATTEAPANPAVEASDVSAARQAANGAFSELQNIGDVVSDFTKEFRNVWEALAAGHAEEERFVDQVKSLLLEVDQHKASIGDASVRCAICCNCIIVQ